MSSPERIERLWRTLRERPRDYAAQGALSHALERAGNQGLSCSLCAGRVPAAYHGEVCCICRAKPSREPLKPGKPLSDKDKQHAYIKALLKDIEEKR